MTTIFSSIKDFFNNMSPETLIISAVFFIYLAFIGIFLLSMIVDYILQSIALFRMASKSGYDKPWLALIPFARQYIAVNLPYRKFNFCGFYQTYDRDDVFKWYIILKITPAFVYLGLFGLILVISFIPLIGSLIQAFFSFFINIVIQVATAAYIIYTWFIRNDLFELYGMKKGARIPLLIFTTVVYIPSLYSITLLILSGKEPKFGFGNYYSAFRFITDDEENEEEETQDWIQIV